MTAQDAEMPPDDVLEAMAKSFAQLWKDDAVPNDKAFIKHALSCPAYQSWLASRTAAVLAAIEKVGGK